MRRPGETMDHYYYVVKVCDIYIYSILHILTIVFPDTRNVKYLPIFNGSYSMA